MWSFRGQLLHELAHAWGRNRGAPQLGADFAAVKRPVLIDLKEVRAVDVVVHLPAPLALRLRQHLARVLALHARARALDALAVQFETPQTRSQRSMRLPAGAAARAERTM